MLGLLGRRLVFGVVSLIVASVLIFAATDWLPRDLPARILGDRATPENVAAVRAELRLDQPPHKRYLAWIEHAIRGDLGHSLISGRPVADVVGPRLFNTLFLILCAAVVAVPVSIGLGILAAIGRNGFFDSIVRGLAVAAISVPELLTGYLLMLYMAVQFRWFPAIVTFAPEHSIAENLRAIFLPMLAVLIVLLAHMVRMVRASMLTVLASPYIEMAVLKGLSRRRIVFHHALPNAMAEIIRIIALNLSYLILGVAVVEAVFTYNGLGRLMVDAVSRRDMPVVQGCALIFAAVFIALNLIADVLSILSSPRLRHPR